MSQQQLFAHYELDNSKWKALIFKFLGASLIFHFVLLMSAVYVPAVRDALYVALLFSDAADKNYVNKDYTLTDIEDQATVINLADPNRFRYPEGYFNKGEYVENMTDPSVVAMNDPSLSGMTSTLPPIIDTTPPAPSFPSPVITTPPVSSIPPSVNNPPRQRKQRNVLPKLPKGNPNAAPTPMISEEELAKVNGQNQNTNAKPTPTPGTVAELDENEVNRKPLIDFGVKVDQLQKEKKIDLNQPFAVTVEGELNKGGQLDKAAVTKKEGDQQLTELAKELISVLNASGVLKTLSDITLKDSPRKSHKIKFDVIQDPNNLMVNVVLEFDNADIAYRIQSGANTAIGLTKTLRKDKIEGQLMENVRAETDGKLVVFKSVIPRQTAEKMIQDQLASAVKQQNDPTKQ